MTGTNSDHLWSKIRNLKKRVPIIKWLPQYTLSFFLQDLLAGLTVGMTEIPQGVAYATVAEYGLYSGIADGFIYAIFGSCKDINIGPSSILSLLIYPAVVNAGPAGSILLTFLSGVTILVLAVLRLGFVIHFFSYPVVSGFVCSGVTLVGLSQLPNLLGITGKTNEFIESWKTIVYHIDEVRKWDAVLGISSLLFLVILKEIRVFGTLQTRPDWSTSRNIFGKIIYSTSLARSILVLIFGTSLSYYLRQDSPFKTVGLVSAGFPTIQTPSFSTSFNGTTYNFIDLVASSGLGFIFIPLVAILEQLSLAKVFNKGNRVDVSQEMLALGLCNFVGCFVGSMPVTGSFSRTTINNASGVRTTFGGVFTSLLLILAIAFLTPTFYYVPKTTLAAVLMGALIYLFDYQTPILLWKTRSKVLSVELS